MRRGRLLVARRVAAVVALALSLCTAGQAVSPPTAKARTLPAAHISVGTTHACAVISGAAYCWGSNDRGELGDGSTTDGPAPVAVTGLAGRAMAEITAGQEFTCALDDVGAAYCWGDNGRGELGMGGDVDYDPHPIPVEVVGGHVFTTISAAAVGYHVCALDTDGKAWCWGLNSGGQLGCGPVTTPPDLTCPSLSTAPVAVALPEGTTLTQIVTGNDTTCALDNAGHAWCWGANGSGQLGHTPSPGGTSNVPVAVTDASGTTLSGLQQITVGIGFSCALDSAGAAYCWGNNTNGQLGCGPITTPPDLTCPNPSTAPVAVRNPAGGLPGLTLTQITAGQDFTCGLDSAGAAYCWGLGNRGQTGNGLYNSSNRPVAVYATYTQPPGETPVLEGVTLTQISAGESFACAMGVAGNIYCWGSNDSPAGIGAFPGYSAWPLLVLSAVLVEPGLLSITVPDAATLGSATAGGIASGQLGPVTVTDDRATGAGSWTVAVSMTDFTNGVAPAPVYTIPATAVTYTIAGPPDAFTSVDGTPPANHARPLGVTFGTAAAPPALPGNDVAVVSGSGTYAATWNPTISVAVPRSAVPGTYTATITHSVT
jgi:alpha-tubulin suppressor-like RCC1 family protein